MALASFSEGILAEENADADQSLAAYRKVLDLDPGFSELAVKVAMELVRRKSFDQAINILKDVVSPKDPAVPLLVSQIYSKYLKKPEPAIRYATQALDLDPNNIPAYLALFEAQVANRQPKKAEQVLERAAKINNRNPQFWLQLGEIYSRGASRTGTTNRTGDGQSPKQEDLEKVNAVYRKALDAENRESGPDPEVLLRVADYYTVSGQYKEAIPLYEKIIKQPDPDAMLPSVQEKLARCYRVAGRTPEAIRSLKEMIKQNPLRYESYELLAEIYEEEGDLENALANYQQTLLMKPDQPVNYLRVADLLLKVHQSGSGSASPARTSARPARTPDHFSKAVDVLKEAHARFPEVPQITYSLGIALAQGKKSQEALAAFADCYNDAKSSQPEMLNGAFYFAYGAAAEQAGNLEQAEVMLKRSIEVDPDNSSQACNYLGYMWAERGVRLEEAGKLIERALEISPGNGAFLDSLGWYYFKKGDYSKALEELKKAVAIIKPEDSVVFEHLGDTWFNLGNTAEALAHWRKALALEALHSPVRTANKGLQEKIESAQKPITAISVSGTADRAGEKVSPPSADPNSDRGRSAPDAK